MKRNIAIVATAALLIALAGCGKESAQPLITGTVVSLDGLDGVNVAAIKGPAIVNVWGSWCAPCKKEMPYFEEFYATKDPNIQLIGVDVEEKRIEDGRMFARTHGVKWPNLYDSDGRTRQYFGMGVPVTWFINENGEVVHKKIGPVKSAEEIRLLAFQYLGQR
jgi:cytochrome c biogenesis protein CcmG/thiol:disulfide interchange protein DsbE